MGCKIRENEHCKLVQSPTYNYIFRKSDGLFVRWGATKEDDPSYSPFGPEILDLEISSGKCSGNCRFCYKQNGIHEPEVNMTFDQFKNIFDKMPKILNQIAFGVCDSHTNPDMFKMMRYAREHGVIPNVTFNGMDITPTVATLASCICGAIAVSIVNKEKTYDAIQLLTNEIGKPGRTLKQVNIHYVLSEETYETAFHVINDIKYDPRLKKLNAIVFLQYKPKGKNPDAFHSVSSTDQYRRLINCCEDHKVGLGFDSCSAHLFFKAIAGRYDEEKLKIIAEPCESNLFSFYTNCKGMAFPCSFCEGASGWEEGVSILDCDNFIDVWNHPRFQTWRKTLLDNQRSCPVYCI
jgi:hypothetical protein